MLKVDAGVTVFKKSFCRFRLHPLIPRPYKTRGDSRLVQTCRRFLNIAQASPHNDAGITA